MDVNDLNYLLDSVKGAKKNKYRNVNVGTNSSYVTYLRHSGFNYDIETITASKKKISIFSKYNELIDSFHYPLYPNSTLYASKLTRDKFKTENYLIKWGFNTTLSRVYSYNQMEQAKSDFFKRNQDERVVIKPLNSSIGRSVFVNVSAERFEVNWKHSKEDLTVSELRREKELKFIVQNFLSGFEVSSTILQGGYDGLREPPRRSSLNQLNRYA